MYRRDVLAHAYERCQANGGAAGVDRQIFEGIEAHGKERWLDELAQELKSRTYQPQPVRRVYIPGWEAETVRDTDNPRSGCANGSSAGSRTYI